MTSRIFINFTNECAQKKKEKTNSSRRGASPKWTNCRLQLSPRYLFSGSSKLILQADHPSGIIRFYKNPRLYEKFLFRLRVLSREHLFATFPPIHARKRILGWLSAGEITSFSFLYFFPRSWPDQLRTRRERIATADTLAASAIIFCRKYPRR